MFPYQLNHGVTYCALDKNCVQNRRNLQFLAEFVAWAMTMQCVQQHISKQLQRYQCVMLYALFASGFEIVNNPTQTARAGCAFEFGVLTDTFWVKSSFAVPYWVAWCELTYSKTS
jgi:hypothetical protein